MDRGARGGTVHGVAKSQTKLKRLSTHSTPNAILGTKDIIISKVV